MKRFGVNVITGRSAAGMLVRLDVAAPVDSERRCTFKAGPVVGRVVVSSETSFPEGTLLYGHLWIDEKEARRDAVYTEAELPGGERLPVCLMADRIPLDAPECDESVIGVGPGRPL
jgi:hypothetical protein